ncbi:MAG: hypothetical protein WBV61_12995 [Rhodanobacteraceae bacterium]
MLAIAFFFVILPRRGDDFLAEVADPFFFAPEFAAAFFAFARGAD